MKIPEIVNIDGLYADIEQLCRSEMPDFDLGRSNEGGVIRTFAFHDGQWGRSAEVGDETRITLGFNALRVVGGIRVIYEYSTNVEAIRTVAPEDLEIPELAWHELWDALHEDSDDYPPEACRQDVIDMIKQRGWPCEEILTMSHKILTNHQEVYIDKAREYRVDEVLYPHTSHSDLYGLDYEDDTPPPHDTVDESEESAEFDMQFEEIVAETRGLMDRTGSPMPNEQHVAEMSRIISHMAAKSLGDI